MDNNTTQAITTTTSNNEQQYYQSTTLKADNMARSSFLPIFPPKASIITLGVNDHLLLANVPNNQLTPDELLRRQQATNIIDNSTLNNMDNRHEPFCLSPIDIEELSTRLQVKESIIIYNADRLRVICDQFFGLYQYFRRKVLARPDVALKEPTLNYKQMSLILEFF
ncbi:unnamed protein product [Rotaria magnacalcarata]|uniref:Uncharacterized protein n=1 Tax=Rotaria magnacalcarata TaxID=392030 RepID=A0A816UPS1_9BILA|nr:unnamed protein product [Rotaria magnacalcarata]CAF1545017.1 unnamed protein product [Rotaria magnacalcarata]CAF2116378.1 unnamed protein product [Rotaria magnacalcarata]CAF3778902.1 unnamed protein product [Rotaria magnacalcarata]CAF3831324.1 unnamed protein product [Rotaria magnacalcarata]